MKIETDKNDDGQLSLNITLNDGYVLSVPLNDAQDTDLPFLLRSIAVAADRHLVVPSPEAAI
jgi:hypothetical protein